VVDEVNRIQQILDAEGFTDELNEQNDKVKLILAQAMSTNDEIMEKEGVKTSFYSWGQDYNLFSQSDHY